MAMSGEKNRFENLRKIAKMAAEKKMGKAAKRTPGNESNPFIDITNMKANQKKYGK